MEKIKPQICYHPELIPTDWNQPRPEPCEMILTCDCGANQICPVCGWGHCSYPCPCMIKYMKENPLHFSSNSQIMKIYYYKESFKLLFKGVQILYNSPFCVWNKQFYNLKRMFNILILKNHRL